MIYTKPWYFYDILQNSIPNLGIYKKGHYMSYAPYADLRKEFYKRGIDLMDLSLFMNLHGITLHKTQRIYAPTKPTITVGKVRILKGFHNGETLYAEPSIAVKDKRYLRTLVEKHALDENCVVFPVVDRYAGAIRFMPTDDIPTVVGRNMMYLRCPNFSIAVSLSLWLQNRRVVAEVQAAFESKRSLKELDSKFIGQIQVPEEILNPILVKKAVDIDMKIESNLREINQLVLELEEIANNYG
jgi:hypothetical protein